MLEQRGFEWIKRDDNDKAVVGAFTIVLAISTIGLWLATNRLYTAGERQLDFLRESAAAQSRDMQASIAEALRAATAMENVAQGIDLSAKATQSNSELLRVRTAMQMRAYISVLINAGVYQERDKSLKFEVKPMVINTGNTPAHKFTYWATAGILPFPLPNDFDFPEGQDNLKSGFVLGPHQSIIINAIVPGFVDDNEVVEIKIGRYRRAYVWGVVLYEDVFGEPHQTKFCHNIVWVDGPQGEFFTGTYAAKHNDAN